MCIVQVKSVICTHLYSASRLSNECAFEKNQTRYSIKASAWLVEKSAEKWSNTKFCTSVAKISLAQMNANAYLSFWHDLLLISISFLHVCQPLKTWILQNCRVDFRWFSSRMTIITCQKTFRHSNMDVMLSKIFFHCLLDSLHFHREDWCITTEKRWNAPTVDQTNWTCLGYGWCCWCPNWSIDQSIFINLLESRNGQWRAGRRKKALRTRDCNNNTTSTSS